MQFAEQLQKAAIAETVRSLHVAGLAAEAGGSLRAADLAADNIEGRTKGGRGVPKVNQKVLMLAKPRRGKHQLMARSITITMHPSSFQSQMCRTTSAIQSFS